jgi:hypothetical protein
MRNQSEEQNVIDEAIRLLCDLPPEILVRIVMRIADELGRRGLLYGEYGASIASLVGDML